MNETMLTGNSCTGGQIRILSRHKCSFVETPKFTFLNDSILEKVLEEPVFSLSCSSCDLEDLLNPLRSRIKKNQPKLIVLETHSLYKKIREKGVVKTRLPTTWANFF